jgi:hypothetical protein
MAALRTFVGGRWFRFGAKQCMRFLEPLRYLNTLGANQYALLAFGTLVGTLSVLELYTISKPRVGEVIVDYGIIIEFEDS